MNFKRWRPELIGLIVAAFATRIWTLFSPNAVVFDEVYFKAFAAHYLDGHYYFDIHPPLGKLILAGYAHLSGLTPDAMLNGTAVGLRLVPAVAGLLLVPLVWGILRRLGASRPFAFLGGLLILLDNALLVESRFILMDSMLLLFGLGGIYFYLVARDTTTRRRWLWLTLAAISAGAAMSIKWTGLSSLAIIGLVWLWDQPGRKARRLHRLSELALFAIIPLIIYLGSFWLHFKLLPLSGDGDAFMLPRFQATLIGNSHYDPTAHLDFIDKFAQLNYDMYQANQTLTATHPYGSHWYTWPLEQRPVYYWQGDVLSDGRQGNIYLLGNPVIWWGVWIAIITGILYAIIKRRRLRAVTVAGLAVTGTAYLINFVPFMAVSRVMFLYHYFFSFIFSLMCAVLLWNDLASDQRHHQLTSPDSRRIYALIVLLIMAGFLFFAPLTYGIPLTPTSLQTHMWLPSWR
jgi:dolichyl-phosphate-mannose-protein mannosyltransferase